MLLILFYFIDYCLIGIVMASIINYLKSNRNGIEFLLDTILWPIVLVAIIWYAISDLRHGLLFSRICISLASNDSVYFS